MFPSASHLFSPRWSPIGKCLCTISLVLSLVVLTSSRAQAQWVTDGLPVCTAIGNQGSPAIIPDGVGGMIVCWEDRRSGDDDVFVQRVNAWGTPQWAANGVVISSAGGSQWDAELESDGAGGAIVVWTDERGGPANSDIYAQHVSAEGTVQWIPNGLPLCIAPNPQHRPTIAVDGAGGAIIGWIDERSGGGSDDVYAQRVDSSGNLLWAVNGLAICTADHNSNALQIVRDGTGGAILAWGDLRNDEDLDIYAQRVTGAGEILWTANGIGVCNYETIQWASKLITDGAGGAIVVWEDAFGFSNEQTDVYAQRVNSAGLIQWPARGVALSDTYFDNQGGVDAVSDGAGGAIVSWHDWGGANPLDIRAQRVDGTGSVLWATNGVIVSDAVGDQMYPTLTSDGVGGAIITWQNGYINDTDVLAQRIDASGSTLWAHNGVAICVAANEQTRPVIASDGAEGALIAWTDSRKGYLDSDVYAYRVSSSGQPTAVVDRENTPRFTLHENVPNPFSSQTRIEIDIRESADVKIEVFDVTGRIVRAEALGRLNVGAHQLDFGGRDGSGRPLPSGVYFYRVNAGEASLTRKIVIAR